MHGGGFGPGPCNLCQGRKYYKCAAITVETSMGFAEVRQVFERQHDLRLKIAGCKVTRGWLALNNDVRVTRAGRVLYEGRILELKQHRDSVGVVVASLECGVTFCDFNDPVIGDSIECYKRELKEATGSLFWMTFELDS